MIYIKITRVSKSSPITDNPLGDYLRRAYGRDITDEEFLHDRCQLTEYLKLLVKVGRRERVLERLASGELKDE